MSMKTKAKLIWCAFAVCLIGMLILRVAMELQKLDYREVQVQVVSAETKHVRHRRTRNTHTYQEVKVAYEGKVQKLRNTYTTSLYTPGRDVKAYLSNGRLYANIEGVSTSTPIAKLYFVCLFGSFGFVILGVVYTEKAKQGL